MSGPYTMADVRATYKERDAWWTVVLVDPLAGRLVLPIANRTSITPSQLTMVAGVLGLGAAGAFLAGSRLGLIVGAALFYLSFVVDCMDGKLARLKNAGSLFGVWLDYVLDRVKVAACTVGLMTGQFLRTDRTIYLFLAIAVLFGEMFRQLHASHIRDLQRMTTATSGSAVGNGAITPLGPAVHQGVGEPTVSQPQVSTALGSPRYSRTGRVYSRLRTAALARRVRPHLWSGIEFEMFVFIIGPLTGAIVEVTVASAVLLAVFELGIIGKLWVSTRRADRMEGEASDISLTDSARRTRVRPASGVEHGTTPVSPRPRL